MLKKLAKYGNSTTLVIDKAILELLNMNESSVVKLHTDGKSLIITPVHVEQVQNEKLSFAPSEALLEAANSVGAKMSSASAQEAAALELAQMNEQDQQQMQAELSAVFAKNIGMFKKFHNEIEPTKEFQEKLGELSEKYNPVSEPETYIKAFDALKNQYCPELKLMNEELAAITKKYKAKKKVKIAG